jgi:hypothetical protein
MCAKKDGLTELRRTEIIRANLVASMGTIEG